MRRVQSTAMELFTARGFNAVTIEEIAAAADVSPRTVYRYFGTKEGLVLWDEIDLDIGDELARRLHFEDPIDATRNALVDSFAALEPAQEEALLERTKFVYETPEVHDAWWATVQRGRTQLCDAYAIATGLSADHLSHDVTARTCLAIVDAAIDAWQRADGADTLAEVVAAAFDTLPATRSGA